MQNKSHIEKLPAFFILLKKCSNVNALNHGSSPGLSYSFHKQNLENKISIKTPSTTDVRPQFRLFWC